LQRWFSATGHAHARDPYFLYAASNAGSLIALLAYPVLIEPRLGLGGQRFWWTAGLAAAIALLTACALRAPQTAATPPQPAPAAPAAIPAATRWRWLVLSAVPSSLLLSVTSYATTDVMAMPLLWVLPLALYLGTFVLAFGRRAASPGRAAKGQAMLLVPIAVEMFLRTDAAAWALVPLHTAAFFASALVCHRELANSRPDAESSTTFYLYIAAGGALGGMFNVFVAPLAFHTLLEYPLGLVAAAMLRPPAPTARDERRARRLDVLLPAVLGGVLLVGAKVVAATMGAAGAGTALVPLSAVLIVAGTVGYAFRTRPVRFGLALAAIMGVGIGQERGNTHVIATARSFYGTHKVALVPPTTRTLAHGNTTHGAQDLDRRREPLTYYHRTGPIGGVMAAWRDRPQRRRVGVVGLGAGSLAAYVQPGERWTFFEIDPTVVEIARDRGLFTYLQDAPEKVDVVVGDGRLTIAAVPDGELGILVLDAFSSDAVPAHVLTREALALYVRKLAPGGIIAVHLSNRYLDLEPVAAGAAASLDLAALVRFDNPTEAEAKAWKTASHWMVLARAPADLAPLAADPRWKAPERVGAPWTDDASNLWGPLRL
jgi:SAM-dependent methyltransferase